MAAAKQAPRRAMKPAVTENVGRLRPPRGKAKRPKTPLRKLTPRHRLFISEYMKDFCAAHAYRRAGFKASIESARVLAHNLLHSPIVAEEIKRLTDARVQRVELSADKVLQEVARLAFSDMRRLFDADGNMLAPKDWPEDLASAVASVETVEQGGKDGGKASVVRKVRAWDKPAALTLAMRHLALLVDRQEVSGPGGAPIRQEVDVSMTPAEAYRATLGG